MWPVFGQDAAGFGPGTCRIELSVPFQRPEFFEANLSDGPIKEKTVDVPVVPVYAEGPPTTTQCLQHVWSEEIDGITLLVCGVEKRGDVGSATERENVWGMLTSVNGGIKHEVEQPKVESVATANRLTTERKLPGSKRARYFPTRSNGHWAKGYTFRVNGVQWLRSVGVIVAEG